MDRFAFVGHSPFTRILDAQRTHCSAVIVDAGPEMKPVGSGPELVACAPGARWLAMIGLALAACAFCAPAARAADPGRACSSSVSLAAGIGDNAGMVFVPGGAFVMGSDSEQPEERYTHLVRVDGFWIDTHEVTNAEFATFVEATGYITQAERKDNPGAAVFVAPTELTRGNDITQWWEFRDDANWRAPAGGDSSIIGKENHPVVDVTYEDALAYAKWRGHDLPTEAEWEFASRGGQRYAAGASDAYDRGRPTANTWQGVFPVLNTGEDGYPGTAPVGCFTPNAYGLYDMIGNVWEWTSDWYRRGHARQPAVNPTGPAAPVVFDLGRSPSKVIKGGSFLCASNYCARYRTSSRQPQEVDLGTTHVGFRTIRRVAPAQTTQQSRQSTTLQADVLPGMVPPR